MCSRMRGPAIRPSLVTWPMISTVVAVSLAYRTSRAADSRTCDGRAGRRLRQLGVHGLDGVDHEHAARGPRAASSRTASTRVSAARRSVPDSSPSRRARSATWRTDSSPVAYSTGRSRLSASAACSSSVDLPMPGSPPSSDHRARPRARRRARGRVRRCPYGARLGLLATSVTVRLDALPAALPPCRRQRQRRGRQLERVPGLAGRALPLPLRRPRAARPAHIARLALGHRPVTLPGRAGARDASTHPTRLGYVTTATIPAGCGLL